MRSSIQVAHGRKPQVIPAPHAALDHPKQVGFKPGLTLKAAAPTAEKTTTDPAKGESLAPLHTLVRKLVTETSLHGDRPTRFGAVGVPDPEDEDFFPYGSKIILNVEVDGVRCLLIKNALPDATIPANVRVCLSPREQEITRLIALGYPNKAVADILEISAWTVSTHLRRIFTKFRVSSRAAMVACFLQRKNEDTRVH